jgi:hypothetical protein
MTWRKIGLYYGLAAVLGAYLAIVHGARGPEVALPTEAPEPIVPLLASRVTDVVVRWQHAELRLSRDDAGRWVARAPADAVVTSDLVNALLDTLTTIAPIEVIDETTARSPEYGLLPPVAVIRVAEGDADPIEVDLGRHNPTRTAVYAGRPDQDKTYLIGLASRYYVELLREQLEGEVAVRGASD